MGEIKERVEHCLALKVMRLTKPAFGFPNVVQSAESDITKNLLSENLLKDVNCSEDLNSVAIGKLLLLPQSFGNIYLGETFCSYVCVHNDSTDSCKNISVKADLQTATQRLNLVSGQDNSELPPGGTIDHVIQHEVKELGTHILVCDVTYSSPSSEKLNFRKFFKFQVMKPLDVKTKFYNAESEDVYLEAQVQNITQASITLERVALEPSSSFTVTQLKVPAVETEPRSVFSSGACLQSQDSWQYLFSLSPRGDQSNLKSLKSVSNIGKLDIVWRTSYCDKGRLQTSQLQRMLPSTGDIKLYFVAAPAFVLLGHPFPLTINILNNCERTVELDLTLDTESSGRLIWTGITAKGLGLIEPGGTVKVDVEGVLHYTGLNTVSGIKLEDTLLKRTYHFNDQIQIYVVKEKDLFNVLTDNTQQL